MRQSRASLIAWYLLDIKPPSVPANSAGGLLVTLTVGVLTPVTIGIIQPTPQSMKAPSMMILCLGTTFLSSALANFEIATAIVHLPTMTVNVGGSPYAASNVGGNYIIAGQTVTSGGAGITMNGQVISAQPNAAGLVIAGSMTVGPMSGSIETIAAGGTSFTATKVGNNVIIGTATLTPGGAPVTINGQVFSEQAGGVGLVVGTTQSLSFPGPTTEAAGATITPAPGQMASAVVVDGVTLTMGAPGISVGGELISYNSNGLVFNGTTTVAVSTISAEGETTTTPTSISTPVFAAASPAKTSQQKGLAVPALGRYCDSICWLSGLVPVLLAWI